MSENSVNRILCSDGLPRISVICPCYNNGKYVAQAIESVLAQTYNDWELVIVNDGSTDESEQVVMQYAATDRRIKYIRQENAGVSAARNRGVQEAVGEYICFLDADHWLDPECLKVSVTILGKQPTCKLYCLKRIDVDDDTGTKCEFVAYPGSYRNVLIYGMSITIVIRRNVFVAIGGFDESMRSGFEDWEFNVRFLDVDSKVIISDEALYYYQHSLLFIVTFFPVMNLLCYLLYKLDDRADCMLNNIRHRITQ